jgi:hypothetical protein
MKKTNIEVEGGELLIMSNEGHYAVIPAKHRQEVADMIKGKCDDCINKYIQTLPKESDYAEDGTLLPSWGKIKATLNPHNWGVTDYTDRGSFDNAYATAKQAGKKEFMWNNERKTVIDKNIPGKRIRQRDDFTGNFLSKKANEVAGGNPDRDKFFGENLVMGITSHASRSIVNREEDYKEMYDLYRYYFGQPLKENVISKSKYAPNNAKNNLDNYISINDDEFIKQIIQKGIELNIQNNTTVPFSGYAKYNAPAGATRTAPSPDKVGHPYEYKRPDGKIIKGVYGITKEQENEAFKKHYKTHALGNFRIGKGTDERGEYFSYYDLFDIARGNEKNNTYGTAKPFEVYDRVYVRDYGDGQKKRMYYSDKELSELDVSKKNFDTKALQRELSNRGYELPKSTKEDGDFDGVLGGETKAALLDYQVKIKSEEGNMVKPIRKKINPWTNEDVKGGFLD